MSEIEEARREGYVRGLGVGLFWIGAFSALHVAGWTMLETPRFRSVFEQVKVPMPGLTELLMESYAVVGVGLAAAVAVAAYLTFFRKLEGKHVVQLNTALLIAALAWSALCTLAVKGPFLTLMQGLGTRR